MLLGYFISLTIGIRFATNGFHAISYDIVPNCNKHQNPRKMWGNQNLILRGPTSLLVLVGGYGMGRPFCILTSERYSLVWMYFSANLFS